MSLDDLRIQIDKLDLELLDIINQRLEVVKKVGKLKHKSGGAIYRPEREKSIIQNLIKSNNGILSKEAIEAIYLEIFAISRNLEKPEKVGFLGPEGSFTHQAAESRFGALSEYVSLNSIKAVFKAVESKKVKFGVVPVENSSNGMVIETLTSFYDSSLKIVAEVITPIHHGLASKSDNYKDIKKIYSKDIAFAQCQQFLESYGFDERVELIPVESTAKAALLASKEPNSGAICSHVAAKIYNVPLVFENIEDKDDNFTRFLIISDFENSISDNDRTSIIATLPNKPGALVSFLKEFEQNSINLTKIESRPSKRKDWEYYFFIDLIGHMTDPQIIKALKKLADSTIFMKILGSYPIINYFK